MECYIIHADEKNHENNYEASCPIKNSCQGIKHLEHYANHLAQHRAKNENAEAFPPHPCTPKWCSV
jgi:hypothetical protein